MSQDSMMLAPTKTEPAPHKDVGKALGNTQVPLMKAFVYVGVGKARSKVAPSLRSRRPATPL